MLIKTLIKRLEKLDGSLPVIVDGYEGGVDDVTKIKKVKMVRNVNTEWYYGKHEEVSSWNKSKGKQVNAMHLS